VFISDDALTAGVAQSWIVLGMLGAVLVVIAALVADRLGRSMVQPVNELSVVASKMGHGDLSVRVEPAGPPEVEEVGIELNRLAERITRLLQDERESAADLAHRLRTPLTAARLSVDGLEDGPHKERLIADLDELQRTTDFIIREARRPVRRESEEGCDISVVVTGRVDFWLPLAEEQGRTVNVVVAEGAAPVSVPQGDAEAMIDALLENALSHTPEGTGMKVDVSFDGDDVVISVEDAGQGFVDGSVIDRGASSADSTGLGLDIVVRTAERTGGGVRIGTSIDGGGEVSVVFGAPVVTTAGLRKTLRSS